MKKIVVIGGGISGLSVLHFIKRLHPEADVTLYEATDRIGGTIGTDIIDGYNIDWGPNGFLDKEPLTLKLVKQIGFNQALEKANSNVNRRYIFRKNKLRAVPLSPVKFLTSNVLSFNGKLRLLMEPFSSSKVSGQDESIYDFAKRHIGQEAADYLVQPMVSGIYGGLANKLSLQSAFPVMAEMEAAHGTLFKAMQAKKKAAKSQGTEMGGPAGPKGWLTTFTHGLHALVRHLFTRYQENIVTGKPVQSIEMNSGQAPNQQGNGYEVHFKDGQTVATEKCVLAVPAFQAASIVDSLSSSLARWFEMIPYAPISVICFGYDRKQVAHPLDGFGFLMPRKENRNILGSIWASSIFKDRAPNGKILLRTMIGGDGDHRSIALSDEKLIEKVRTDLDPILEINGSPEIVKIYRWERGIPQFIIGHANTVQMIEGELTRLGNLFITGNAYYGVSLNDCIKQSFRVAQQL